MSFLSWEDFGITKTSAKLIAFIIIILFCDGLYANVQRPVRQGAGKRRRTENPCYLPAGRVCQPENPQLPAPDFRYPKPRDFRPYRGADAEPVKGRLQRPCGNHHRQLLLRPVFGRQGAQHGGKLPETRKRYAILVREEFSCLINSHEQGHEQLDSGKLNTGGHK